MIDESKQQLGVMSLGDALRLAQQKGLDLLETVPNASPPVCRIVNYGKFQYEEAKRAKDHSHRQAARMKEIQISPGIAIHDFNVKLAHAVEFLSTAKKVCLKMRFRGRQRAHKEFGFDLMNRFIAQTAAYGRPDAPPKLLGDRDLTVVINPLPQDKLAKKRAVTVEGTSPKRDALPRESSSGSEIAPEPDPGPQPG